MRCPLEKQRAPAAPMIPYVSNVLAKRKRLKSAENRVLHVREAIIPARTGEEVAWELKDSSPQTFDCPSHPW